LNDNLTNDYKLNDGINRKHCALNLLEKYGFDKELVNDANEMYNSITNN
jgi:DNA mismatch repair ATPase MutS